MTGWKLAALRYCARILLFIAAVLMPFAAFVPHAYAGMTSEAHFRIEVSKEGFDGNPNLVIEVEQGQHVEMTFVWDDTAVPANAHKIRIDGYDQETVLLDRTNPEATVSFFATQSGEFGIYCVWPCKGHKANLQRGKLIVKPGSNGSGNSAQNVATNLTLRVTPLEAIESNLVLSAILRDSSGKPIVGAAVRFFVEASTGGVSDDMEIGIAKTNTDGLAVLEYASRWEGEHKFSASFVGKEVYMASAASTRFNSEAATPAYTVQPRGLESIGVGLLGAVALIILSIWTTFAFVLYQIYRIKRGG